MQTAIEEYTPEVKENQLAPFVQTIIDANKDSDTTRSGVLTGVEAGELSQVKRLVRAAANDAGYSAQLRSETAAPDGTSRLVYTLGPKRNYGGRKPAGETAAPVENAEPVVEVPAEVTAPSKPPRQK